MKGRSGRHFASQAEADRFVRRRKKSFRLTAGSATALTILLAVMGIGAYQSSPPSYERLLPPPNSAKIEVPRSVQDGDWTGKSGVAANLSGAYTPADVGVPTRLLIPAVGVDAPVIPLGRNPDGTAQVPSSVWYTGWYDLGPRPGQLGPAVILGHVDSYTSPGVFYRLRSLLPGDLITVISGTQSVRFEVTGLASYEKDEFPTAAVFGPTPDAELRLITCSGQFDTATGHYLDNLVVYAIRVT
jgi:sortase (surface protein transpeptidase)